MVLSDLIDELRSALRSERIAYLRKAEADALFLQRDRELGDARSARSRAERALRDRLSPPEDADLGYFGGVE